MASSSSDESDSPPPTKAAKAKPVAAVTADTSSDDEETVPAKPAVKTPGKPAAAAKAKTPGKTPGKTPTKAAAAAAPAPMDDSDSDEEEEEEAAAAPPAKGKRKATDNGQVATKKAKPESSKPEASPETRTIHVGGLSFEASKEDLKQFFQECGNIVDTRIATWENGSSRGFGYVDFEKAESVTAAVAMDGATMMGRWLKISPSIPKGESGKEILEKPEGCKEVFVGNLPWDLEEDTLRELFGGCGTITSCRIATDRETGDSKGFAHIEFEEDDAVDKAVELNKTVVGERTIKVNYAAKRESNGGDAAKGAKGGKGKGKGKGKGSSKGGKGKGKGKGGKGKGKGGKGKGSTKKEGIKSFEGKKMTFDE